MLVSKPSRLSLMVLSLRALPVEDGLVGSSQVVDQRPLIPPCDSSVAGASGKLRPSSTSLAWVGVGTFWSDSTRAEARPTNPFGGDLMRTRGRPSFVFTNRRLATLVFSIRPAGRLVRGPPVHFESALRVLESTGGRFANRRLARTH